MSLFEFTRNDIHVLNAISHSGSEEEGSVEEVEQVEEVNYLSMTDEDFSKVDPNESFNENHEDATEDDNSDDDVDTNESEDDTNEPGENVSEEEDSESSEDTIDQGKNDSTDEGEDEDDKRSRTEEFYDVVMSKPIRAAKREIQIESPRQLRALVEMGADYNEKMRKIKPHRAVIKTLELEGLLSNPEELSLLIAARNGDKQAINKLLMNNDLTALDIADTDENQEDYSPENIVPSDSEIDLGEAVDSIRDSPKYDETVDIISNVLDDRSKDLISRNPQYVIALSQDIESGTYHKIMDEISIRRHNGTLSKNTPDLEAYIGLVGEGAIQQKQHTESTTPANNTNTRSSREKKKAMSTGRGSKKTKVNKTVNIPNPLSMNEEEFAKLEKIIFK